MIRVSEIIKGCQLGVTATCYGKASTVITSASKTCATYAQTSSDTVIAGSFCPKKAGTYKILPKGTIRNSVNLHSFTFDTQKYSLNSEITISLKTNRCYSYQLYDCDYYSTVASIEITFNNNKYILDKKESITCQYSGFLPRQLCSCRKDTMTSHFVQIILIVIT